MARERRARAPETLDRLSGCLASFKFLLRSYSEAATAVAQHPILARGPRSSRHDWISLDVPGTFGTSYSTRKRYLPLVLQYATLPHVQAIALTPAHVLIS